MNAAPGQGDSNVVSLPAILLVAVGGAVGASARYGVSWLLINQLGRFPFATLMVNILGSFLLGLLFACTQQQHLSDSWRLFLGVGLLGSFTTFSTFSLEVVVMFTQGELGKALLHLGLNIIVCIAAVVLAIWLYHSLLDISVK
ncbi:MAG: fluoride efflux transporter CrcB [Pseudomonadota bacterium]